MESDVAAALLAETGMVISMGGGMPVIPEVGELMRRHQESDVLHVVYLDVAVDVLESRLSAAVGDRPGIHGADPVEEVARVHAERDPVYRSLADVICEVPMEEPVTETVQRLTGMLSG